MCATKLFGRALPLAALVCFLIPVTAASAAEHCVGSHPLCSGPNNYAATADGVQSALSAANDNSAFPGLDRVWIEAGTYEVSTQLSISNMTGDLEIIGEGPDQTVFEAMGNTNNFLLNNDAGHEVSISQFGSETAGFSFSSAGWFDGVDVSDAEFRAAATGGSVNAVRLDGGGTLDDSSITLTGPVRGIYSEDSATVSDVKITSTDGASTAFRSGGPGTRTMIRGNLLNVRGGVTLDSGSAVVRDTFIDLGSSANAFGVSGDNFNNCSTCAIEIDVDGVTVVGSGNNQTGVSTGGTGADGVTESGVGTVANTLVHLTGSGAKALRCNKSGDSTTAQLSSSYFAAPASQITRDAGCLGSDADLLDTTASAPVFTFPAVRDFRPAAGSPVIDAGDPAATTGPGDLDADGNARITDGDAVVGDRIDIGAHEFSQSMRPSAALITIESTPEDAGQPIDFTAEAHEPDGGSVAYDWDFGDGGLGANGSTATRSYSSAGDFTVSVLATDDEGDESTSSSTVHINSTPPTTPTAESDISVAYRNQTITFTAGGSTDPDGDSFTYEWEFPGGATASGASVERFTTLMNSPGPTTYTATVRAVDQHNEQSPAATVSVTIVNHLPVITQLDAPDTVVRGQEFTIETDVDDAENDTVWATWEFDGVALPEEMIMDRTQSYDTLGTKTIKLAVRDAYSAQAGPGETQDVQQITVDVVNQSPVLGEIQRGGGSRVGDVQSYAVTGSDADGDPLSYTWNFGDGAAANGPQTSHAFTAPGTFNVVVTGDDGAGGTVVKTAAVTIEGLKLAFRSPTGKFKRTGRGFALGARAKAAHLPVSATLPATVKFTLARKKGGWSKGSRCVVKRPKGGKKRCDLPLKGSVVLKLPEGASRISFGGGWRGKKLPAGSYRVVASGPHGASTAATLRLAK